jgi:tRNA A-37 threonylcarbamoyl transferase component Bud32
VLEWGVALKLSNAVAHTSILECDGGWIAENKVFLQFAFLEGGDLKFWSQKPRPVSRKLNVLTCVLDALASLHSSHIAHRGLNMANIVMTNDRYVFLSFIQCFLSYSGLKIHTK